MTKESAKRGVVTGAGSGIGREIARQLAAEGWSVLAVDVKPDPIKALADEAGGTIKPFAADVAADGSAEKIIAAAGEQLGGLDLLVNNAGCSWVGAFVDMPTEKIDFVLNLNVRGLTLLCREAIGLLRSSARGQIINVASVGAHLPMETIAVYCASKAAVLQFSRVLAKELAPEKIRVDVLSPAGTDTAMFETVGVDIDRSLLVPAPDMARMAVLMTQWPEGLDVGEVLTQKRFSPYP